MARRSIWDDEEDTGAAPTPGSGWGSLGGVEPPTETVPQSTLQPPPPRSILDQLRTAPAKPEALRNRNWEKTNPSATYRLVPNEVRDAVKAVAQELGFTVNLVAQAFLEYALESYEHNELILNAQPGLRGLSLYPDRQQETKKPSKLRCTKTQSGVGKASPKKRKIQRKPKTGVYKQRVSYRLSSGIRDAVYQTARVHAVPTGEVVTAFLQHSLAAYHADEISLEET